MSKSKKENIMDHVLPEIPPDPFEKIPGWYNILNEDDKDGMKESCLYNGTTVKESLLYEEEREYVLLNFFFFHPTVPLPFLQFFNKYSKLQGRKVKKCQKMSKSKKKNTVICVCQ